MYWNSDNRLIQFNFNWQKSGQSKAFYGHWSSPVFLTNILKYRLDCQLEVGNDFIYKLSRVPALVQYWSTGRTFSCNSWFNSLATSTFCYAQL